MLRDERRVVLEQMAEARGFFDPPAEKESDYWVLGTATKGAGVAAQASLRDLRRLVSKMRSLPAKPTITHVRGVPTGKKERKGVVVQVRRLRGSKSFANSNALIAWLEQMKSKAAEDSLKMRGLR